MNRLIYYLRNPKYLLLVLDMHKIIRLSDHLYIKLLYEKTMGKKLNLSSPKTFNEKLQWLKLYDRNPSYTKLVDKYEAKKVVSSMIGRQYIIPTIGIYDKFSDIDFDTLPEKFVMKCTHDSGGIVICNDKNSFDVNAAAKKINKCLKTNYYRLGREWPYKNVKPRVIIEKYIEDPSGDLMDYKFFTFGGKVKYIQVDYDRFTNHKRNIYSVEWIKQPFTIQYPSDAKKVINRPKNFDRMIELAERISSAVGSIPFLRVDFYSTNNSILFGEVTFYHGNGLERFTPEIWDRKLGDLIKLPERQNEK